MFIMIHKKITLLSLLISSLFADSGKKIFETYCIACHGQEGQGVPQAAPPLANSQWVAGDAGRMVEVLLYGVQGKITVHGEKYDLVMPPQAALNSEQVADVANYVRNSWGNVGKKIDASFVEKIKAGMKAQNGMIQSGALVRKYPFSNTPQKIKQLISESFPYTNDLSTLTNLSPDAVEEENSGYISPSQMGGKEDAFSGRWQGQLRVNKKGEHIFSIKAGGNISELWIDDKLVATTKLGELGSQVGKVELKAGQHDLELRYSHQAKSTLELSLFWSGPKFFVKPLHTIGSEEPKVYVNLNLEKGAERALVHRNFFHSPGKRAFAVALKGGINFLFSVEDLSLESIWQGEFLQVGQTWDGRAQGKKAKPLTQNLKKMAGGAALLASKKKEGALVKLKGQFDGYEFDKNGDPILLYSAGGVDWIDQYATSNGGNTLLREIFPVKKRDESLEDKVYLKIAGAGSKVFGQVIRLQNGVKISVRSESRIKKTKTDVVVEISTKGAVLEYQFLKNK